MKLNDSSLIIKPEPAKTGIVITDRRRIKPADVGINFPNGKQLSLPCIHDLHANCQLGDNCWCSCHAIAKAERQRLTEQLVDKFLHRYD